MSLVQLLEPKWYFIYITGTHAELGDDPTEGQDFASVVCEWFTGFKILWGVITIYIVVCYFHIYCFDQMVGCI